MTKPLASLQINKLALSVHLGWPNEERRKKQTVWLDVIIAFSSPPKACVTEELKDTLCYADLVKHIHAISQAKPYKLIEHLTYELYRHMKVFLPKKTTIVLRLTKHPKIKGSHGGMSFEYGDA